MEKFEICIASPEDRERVVSEISYERVQWAEISQENDDELIVQFYFYTNKPYSEFKLEEAIQALKEARNELLEL